MRIPSRASDRGYTAPRTKNLNHSGSPTPESEVHEMIHVLLTGSTGSLGSYLLDRLYLTSQVTKITCLSRSSRAEEVQIASNRSRGLESQFDAARVEFLQSDLTQPDLGLSSEAYTRLTTTVTHIIHNAWPVSFALSFSSFEPSLRGVKHLVDFTANTTQSSLLFFISSISAVARWTALPGAHHMVPEAVIEDWRTAKMGYGQSKLVSENLIANASDMSGIRASICRVGQLSGPISRGLQGQWATNEWFPSLIMSSQHMKVIPEDLGPLDDVDWVPIDLCADVVVELLLPDTKVDPAPTRRTLRQSTKPSKIAVYHITNPFSTKFHSILPAIIDGISNDNNTSLRKTSFLNWVHELEQSARKVGKTSRQATQKEILDEIPAVKLLAFFRELQDKASRFPDARAARLDTSMTVKYSPTLAKMKAVTVDDMRSWMQQWGFVAETGKE